MSNFLMFMGVFTAGIAVEGRWAFDLAVVGDINVGMLSKPVVVDQTGSG